MKSTNALLAGALAVVIPIFAGCGSEDEGTTTSSASDATTAESAGALSADAVAEGNEICAEAQEKLFQAYDELGLGEQPDDAFVKDVVVPNLQGQIDDLRDLDESEELQTVLDDVERILARNESAETFIKGGPFAPGEFRELGLRACASIGSSAPY